MPRRVRWPAWCRRRAGTLCRSCWQSALLALFDRVDARVTDVRRYRVPVELEGLMAASFPEPGQEWVVRQMVGASLADDALGMGKRQRGGRILLDYPAAVVVAEVPG